MDTTTIDFPQLSDLEFATKLRAIRTAKHLSQEEVAKRVGISMISIHRWEHGATKPRPILYTKLRDFFVEGKVDKPKPGVPTTGANIRPDQARFSEFGLDLSMLPIDTLCLEIKRRGFKVTIEM